jgi:hypothetical protein
VRKGVPVKPACVAAVALSLALLSGCKTSVLHAPVDERTARITSASTPAMPPSLEHVRSALTGKDTFSRWISDDRIRAIHEEVSKRGETFFEVEHDGHFHHYFLSYLDSGTQRVLVFGELVREGGSTQVKNLRAWPVQGTSLPRPVEAPAAGPATRPRSCEKCRWTTTSPEDKHCMWCSVELK